MSASLHPLWLLLALLTLIMMGVGILVFLAPVPVDLLTPAQENLLIIGDWMVKVCVGAILGLGGSRLAPAGARGKGGRGGAADLGEAG